MASRRGRPIGDNILFIKWTICIVLAEGMEVGARAHSYCSGKVNCYSEETVLI